MYLILLGIRSIMRAGRFSILALSPLVAGMAAALVIASLGIELYFHSLPVSDPQSLVILRSPGPTFGSVENDTDETVYSYPLFSSLAAKTVGYLALAARSGDIISVQVNGHDATRVRGEFVSDNYFSLLGIRPYCGRWWFTPLSHYSAQRGSADAGQVVLSFGYARERFNNPASALGKVVRVNGHSMLVTGVAPAIFSGMVLGRRPDVYLPLQAKLIFHPEWTGFFSRRSAWLNIFGRLKVLQGRQTSEARVNLLYRGLLAEEAMELDSESTGERRQFLSRIITLLPAGQGIGTLQRAWAEPVHVLFFIATALYGIAWFNFGSLFFVRILRRRQFFGIQYSLGATGRHVLIPLASEIGSLVVLGLIGGGLIAWFLQAYLARNLPPEFSADWLLARPNVLAAVCVIGTSLILGGLLAITVSLGFRTEFTDPRQLSSHYEGFRAFRTAGQLFLGLQGAGTVALMITALLLAASLIRLTSQRLGFEGIDADSIVTVSASPELANYSSEKAFVYFSQSLLSVRGIPGVEAVGLTSNPIFSGLNSFANVTVEGFQGANQQYILVGRNKISPGFFNAVGIPLVSGRDFQEADFGRPVAIINRRFAQLFFGNLRPEGRHVAIGSGGGIVPDLQVVGVVEDYHQKRLRELPIPTLYTSISRSSFVGSAAFYVRAKSGTRVRPTEVAEALRRVDPSIAIHSTDTLARVISAAGAMDKLLSFAALTFGTLSLLLAVGGIVGIVQYILEARHNELAVRSALGASRTHLLWLLGRATVTTAFVAALLGAYGASVLGRLIESRLFGVEAVKVPVYAAGAGLYVAIATAVAMLTARRGSTIDLSYTLRGN